MGESIYEFIEDMKNIEQPNKEEIYQVAKEVFNKPTIHILKNPKVKKVSIWKILLRRLRFQKNNKIELMYMLMMNMSLVVMQSLFISMI